MMKNNIITLIYLIVLSLISTACGSPTPLATGQLIPTTVPVKLTQTNIPIQPPTNIPAATSLVATEAVTPLLTNFQDPSHGFTFDYPIGWVLDTGSFGSRAPISYTLTSWDHEPGLVDEVPAGETILNLTIQIWDPKNDLKAYAENRQIAWDASGFKLISSENLVLTNGNPAKAFIISTPEGGRGYFLLTTFGDDYFVISGNGDLQLIDLVARSFR